MADTTRAADPPKPGGKGKTFAGQPTWVWLAGAGALVVGYLYFRSKSSSSSSQQAGSGSGHGGGGGHGARTGWTGHSFRAWARDHDGGHHG